MTLRIKPASNPIRLPWPQDDIETLKRLHGSVPLAEIAKRLGRTKSSVRCQITRLGIAKKTSWSAGEVEQLRNLYTSAGPDGVLNLGAFARDMGRDPANVCRKAKELGLSTNAGRKVVEYRKDRNKYASLEEARAAASEALKIWRRENEHPRGMKGKRHSDDTRMRLSSASKAAQLFLTEDEKSSRVMKALKTRNENAVGSIAPKVKRGTWQAGWREIGDKRHYFRSRWEANYARYLQWLKEGGHIKEWAYEPETFWFEAILRGVRSYKPDFRVWENDGSSKLHEVKGWMDARSKTCLRRMKKYHPQETIVLIDGPQYRAIRLKVMRLVDGWEDSQRDTHA